MANRRRGEVEAVLGGRRFTLCLTLGALAELESAFGVDDLGALGERLAGGRLSARDVMRLIGAGLRGGGTPIGDAEIAAFPIAGGLEPYAEAVAALLAATFGEAPANPPPPEGEAGP